MHCSWLLLASNGELLTNPEILHALWKDAALLQNQTILGIELLQSNVYTIQIFAQSLENSETPKSSH